MSQKHVPVCGIPLVYELDNELYLERPHRPLRIKGKLRDKSLYVLYMSLEEVCVR